MMNKLSFKNLYHIYIGDDEYSKQLLDLLRKVNVTYILLIALFLIYPFVAGYRKWFYVIIFLLVVSNCVNLQKIIRYRKMFHIKKKCLLLDHISYSGGMLVYSVFHKVLYREFTIDFILIIVSVLILIPYFNSNKKIMKEVESSLNYKAN